MHKLSVFESQYLPSIAWCAAVWPQERILLEANESYRKGSFRNRCHISGPNGMQRLSIPLLKGKHQQMPIREVQISYQEPWQRQHWRSICAAYGSAPYFEHYKDDLSAFYEQQVPYLFDWNLELLKFILIKKMGWKGEFACTEDFVIPDSPRQPHDFRDSVRPAHVAPDWFFPARYGQVFQERFGFMENLSVLDLLFCCGKQGVAQLQKSFMP